ncbi:MAG: chromate efflux transporter [Planctomycetes bacterium]|nr:chromate efflux transporter [Planctomycetota bacterium]
MKPAARAVLEAEPRSIAPVCSAFLKLGVMSFGGPIAHIGYLRAEFVQRRAWLDDAAFADLVALCQFLPGPASSQVVFAIGMRRAGLAGALAASACFTLPSAVLMIAFALGMQAVAGDAVAGWLHGLKLAAVPVVADAVWSMGRRLCTDTARVVLALLAALALVFMPGAWTQVALIAAGGCAGWLLYRKRIPVATETIAPGRHRAAAAALLVFGLLLVALPVAARESGLFAVQQADAFYRAGALVFGGGHVVLPLLRAELVPPGWLTDDQFLAGYGAAQAVPGPLFTFAAYLGTVINAGPRAWLGGLGCLLAIFLPAWLLVGGALPFWQRLRSRAWAQAGLRGANAAVVGVLLAALHDPILPEGVRSWPDALAAAAALALLLTRKVPVWAVVALLAAAGQWVL